MFGRTVLRFVAGNLSISEREICVPIPCRTFEIRWPT